MSKGSLLTTSLVLRPMLPLPESNFVLPSYEKILRFIDLRLCGSRRHLHVHGKWTTVGTGKEPALR